LWLLLQDVLDGGEAARIESLLLREFNKRGFVLPNKPDNKEMLRRKEEREVRGFKGATVLEPKVGLYTTPIYTLILSRCIQLFTLILTYVQQLGLWMKEKML